MNFKNGHSYCNSQFLSNSCPFFTVTNYMPIPTTWVFPIKSLAVTGIRLPGNLAVKIVIRYITKTCKMYFQKSNALQLSNGGHLCYVAAAPSFFSFTPPPKKSVFVAWTRKLYCTKYPWLSACAPIVGGRSVLFAHSLWTMTFVVLILRII